MTPTALPVPVQGYIAASHAFDTEALIAWFADDASVNDACREFQGTGAIRRRLDRELIDGEAGLREGNENLAPGDHEWWERYRSRLELVAQEAGQARAPAP